MFKEMILKLRAALAGLTLDDAKKKEIEDQIKVLEAEAEKKPVGSTTPSQQAPTLDEGTRQLITSLQGQVEGLTSALNKETKAREDQAKAMADRAKAESEKRVADYIKKVVETDKKVSPADMKEKWQPLLESNFEATSKILDVMPPHPATKGPAKDGSGTSSKQGDQPTGNDYQANKKTMVDAAIAEFKSSSN